jgi:hypothetical protein
MKTPPLRLPEGVPLATPLGNMVVLAHGLHRFIISTGSVLIKDTPYSIRMGVHRLKDGTWDFWQLSSGQGSELEMTMHPNTLKSARAPANVRKLVRETLLPAARVWAASHGASFILQEAEDARQYRQYTQRCAEIRRLERELANAREHQWAAQSTLEARGYKVEDPHEVSHPFTPEYVGGGWCVLCRQGKDHALHTTAVAVAITT